MVALAFICKIKKISFRTQQSQREPSDRTLRSPLSANFWRHCVVERRNLMPLFASTPEQRSENIDLNKYLISLSGDRTHNHRVILCVSAPRLASICIY